jgi:hypothetical protein
MVTYSWKVDQTKTEEYRHFTKKDKVDLQQQK